MGPAAPERLTSIFIEALPPHRDVRVAANKALPRLPLYQRNQSAAQTPSRARHQLRPAAWRSHSLGQLHSRFMAVRQADQSLSIVPKAPLPEAIFALPDSPRMRLALAESIARLWQPRIIDGLAFALHEQMPGYAEALGVTPLILATCITALMSDEGYFDCVTRWLARDCSEHILLHRQALAHTQLDAAERHFNRLCTTVRHRSPQVHMAQPQVPVVDVEQVCRRFNMFANLTPAQTRPRIAYVAAHLTPYDLACLQAYLATSEGAEYAASWSQSASERARFLCSDRFARSMWEMIKALDAPAANSAPAPSVRC